MGGDWFENHLENLDIPEHIFEDIFKNPDRVVRGLAGVSKRGDLVELFELTNDATTITRIDHFTL